MVVNGVARIADQQGNVRYSVSRQKTRMGFLPTGALLKISADKTEFQAKPGQKISVAISIDRSPMLTEPITLELCCNATSATVFTAKPVTLAPDVSHAEFSIAVSPSAVVGCEQALTIRATLMKDGEWPVVSETTILTELED